MNRLLDFRDPDNLLAGVLVLAITAVTCGWVLSGCPGVLS